MENELVFLPVLFDYEFSLLQVLVSKFFTVNGTSHWDEILLVKKDRGEENTVKGTSHWDEILVACKKGSWCFFFLVMAFSFLEVVSLALLMISWLDRGSVCFSFLMHCALWIESLLPFLWLLLFSHCLTGATPLLFFSMLLYHLTFIEKEDHPFCVALSGRDSRERPTRKCSAGV